MAITQADLPQQTNSVALAKYLATIHQGLSVQAISGASQSEFMEVVNIAMQNWAVKT